MKAQINSHSEDNTSLFVDVVKPAFKKASSLHAQFERLKNNDVLEHQDLLQEIEDADQKVWQAIALSTADINPELITQVIEHNPIPLSSSDKLWILKCLQEGSIPLIEEGSFEPIRFLLNR